MNYIGLNTCDTANGEGVRVSLFVSGCSLHCKGCFNQESWDFNTGRAFTDKTLQEINEAMNESYCSGLSILGGDPLEPENIPEVTAICRYIKANHPDKTIWLWTGRTYEKVKELELMKYIDVLIDGAFVEKLKIHDKCAWRGSSNQKIHILKDINSINK